MLLGFVRALRTAGVSATPDRGRTFLLACACVGLSEANGVYLAGRATLCSSPQDRDRYDQAYAAWFGGLPEGRSRQPTTAFSIQAPPTHGEGFAGGSPDADAVRARASSAEILRHRDIAGLSPAERAATAALFAAIRPEPPLKRAVRQRRARQGSIDGRATLRDQVRRMGEPGRVHRRDRSRRPRRVVLLIDVSGSMSAYADSLVRLAHRFVRSGGPVEVFTVGTRLTHLTRALQQPDADRALVSAGAAVPDWSGGTRLGETLAAFLALWGRRGMARGAVVVVFSDGWEREGPELLGEQMRQLRRLAHCVLWVNPHKGKVGYQPVQGGMAAALPHVDHFLAGHSLATFEELTAVVARA